MQYALLFYNPPLETVPPAEREHRVGALLADMAAWRKDLESAGVFRTSMRLVGVEAATSLRAKGDDVVITDGPVAEPTEILAGLVVLECADLDDAIGWAKRCPIVRIGTVEVRPEFAAPR
jgi:hypothetical protein